MPLGIYIHFPYCRSICPYCNFNVHVRRQIPHEEYADAVLAELRARMPDVSGRSLASVYFGGGTPGLWEPATMRRILRVVDQLLGLPVDAEITAEVNPDFLGRDRLRDLRSAGVNRVSIGVQSLRDAHLRALGRLHSAAEALQAVDDALEAGFRSVSADFICALPSQTLAEWEEDLERLTSLGCHHLSIYGLTVEPETPLAAWVREGRIVVPGEDEQADELVAARARLRAAGYEHYEVSNFARPGHRAVHNSLYWHGEEYLGLGAGAHGFLRQGPGGFRWADVDDPDAYMRRSAGGELPEAWRELRSTAGLAEEALMTGLRWLDGIDFAEFAMRTGSDLRRTHAGALRRLADLGLALVGTDRLHLTERGILLLNAVTLEFFSPRNLDKEPSGGIDCGKKIADYPHG